MGRDEVEKSEREGGQHPIRCLTARSRPEGRKENSGALWANRTERYIDEKRSATKGRPRESP